MPTHAGPNIAGKNSLAFAYDTGDISNSYKGEPTSNLINPNGPGIYTWWGRNVQTITQLSETYKGHPIYRVSLSIDNGDMLYHITARWGAGSGWYLSYATYYANTPYIASIIYRPVSHSDTRVHGHPSNISGWGLTVDDSIDLAGGWKQHRIDRNYSTTVGDNRFYHMYTPSATIGQTVTIDITNCQIEAKSYTTPFIDGTRSSTQGLLPVIGNSTIDLSNVSFDSNAQMTFDGTNDYASVTLPSSIGVYCLEMVWYNNNAIPNNDTAIGGPTTYQTPIEFNGNGQGVHLGAWTGGLTNEAIHIWGPSGVTSNRVYAGVGYHHIVFNWNGTTYDIWVDGVNTTTYYGSGTNYATLITATSIKLGNDVNGYCFNGKIPITKIYNSALTAAEIQQNYQQYKTRFNLS
jgi:hypothetical protein